MRGRPLLVARITRGHRHVDVTQPGCGRRTPRRRAAEPNERFEEGRAQLYNLHNGSGVTTGLAEIPPEDGAELAFAIWRGASPPYYFR